MDYIPGKEEEYAVFMDNFVPAIDANKTVWGVPDPEAAALTEAHAAFKAAFSAATDPATRTSVAIAVKNAAKERLTAQSRQMVEFRIRRNPAVSAADLVKLGLRPFDANPTPGPAPDTIPEIEVALPAPRTLRVKFRAANAKRWGKPAGAHGLELLWVAADAPPAEIEDLLHSAFATKSPLELTFKESERGKRVYFAARWESGAALKGKWSDIFNAVIP